MTGSSGEKRNYHKEMLAVIRGFSPAGEKPSLLLHCCCAPCASAVIERLTEHFAVTAFFYNPNILPREEYLRRRDELVRLLKEMTAQAGGEEDGRPSPAAFIEGPAGKETYYSAIRGLEQEPERGRRCEVCFRLRLEETARKAAEEGFDWFTTTLTISPHKDAEVINRIGKEAAEKFGVSFLPCDFKKADGYLRSLQLSERYGLYRQDYCGCGLPSGRDTL